MLKSLQLVAKIESSESSNRLEGIELPHKKIEELVLKDTIPKNRSEQEIAGYRDALNLIHESQAYAVYPKCHSAVTWYIMPLYG